MTSTKQTNPLRSVHLDAAGRLMAERITEYCDHNIYIHDDMEYMEHCRDLSRNTRQMVVLYNIFSRAYFHDDFLKRGHNLFDFMSKFCDQTTDYYQELIDNMELATSEGEVLAVLEMLWRYILDTPIEYDGDITLADCDSNTPATPELKALTQDKKHKSRVPKVKKVRVCALPKKEPESTSKTVSRVGRFFQKMKEQKSQVTELERAMIFFRHESPDIQYVDFDREDDPNYKYILVLGDIQSGKTIFAMCSMAYTVMMGIPCVYVVKGDRAQYRQFKSHFIRFNNKFTQYMHAHGFSTKAINSMYVGDSSQFNEQQFVDMFSGLEPGIAIALCNKTQVGRVVSTIDEYSGWDWDFHVFADEADELCYHKEGTGTRTAFEELREKCKRIYGITATGYEQLLCEIELLKDAVIVLSPRPGYKGPMQITYKVLPHSAKSCSSKGEQSDMLRADRNLSYYFDMLAEQNAFTISSNGRKHPIMALHKTSRYTKQHEKVLEYIREQYPRKFAVLIFNGDGVRMYHHSLTSETIDINGRRFASDMAGTYLLSNVNIQTAVQYLKDNGGVERFPRIVIISGDLADRGINFVSDDFKWHLTHEYLLASDKGKNMVPDLVQALRLCGVYQDDIPLSLFTTEKIKENIINGYHFQKDKLAQLQIEMIEDDVLRRRHRAKLAKEEKIPVKDIIADFPTYRKKLGTAKFSTNKYKLNRVNVEDGGISMMELNEIKNDLVEVWEINKDNDLSAEDQKGLQAFAIAYNNGSARHAIKMIQVFQAAAFSSFTLEELRDTTGIPTLHISSFTSWNLGRNKYYKLVQRTASGRYELRPEVKSYLKL